MNPCQATAPLLALSAAGLLDADEERAVREHVRECPACAARLESLGNLAGALSALPAPAPPADLALRTQGRLAAELDSVAERRRGGVLALAGAALAWISWFALWELYRILTGGIDSLLRLQWPNVWVWLAISMFMVSLAAPAAAALARARRRERNIL